MNHTALRLLVDDGQVIIRVGEEKGRFQVQRVTPGKLTQIPNCDYAVKELMAEGYLESIFDSPGWKVLKRSRALLERRRFLGGGGQFLSSGTPMLTETRLG